MNAKSPSRDNHDATTTMSDPYLPITLDLSNVGAPRYLARKVQEGIKGGYRVFQLRLKSKNASCFPNVCVPLAGILDYYRDEHGCRFINSVSWRKSTYLKHAGILEPHMYDLTALPGSFLDRVWKFTPDTHYDIVREIMESIRRTDHMAEGVLDALELVLNEVTDNTLQHFSEKPEDENATGYVMVQYHKGSHHVAVAVFDTGQGIPASLMRGGHKFESTTESLLLALRKGVTDGNGAGNGLWLMDRVVAATSGSFTLASDGIRYFTKHYTANGEPRSALSIVSKIKDGTTLVDLQLQTDSPIDLVETLDGYSHVDLWVEDRLESDFDNARMRVDKDSRGCASRYEGKAFANKVCNLLSNIPGQCILDFTNIDIVSASFIDELVSDLLVQYGFVGFLNRVRFVNLSAASIVVMDACFRNRYFKLTHEYRL
ncbi:ATP-binding protein [Adlercreutzia sp. ZJ138]|uniref:ATP-binding protein n=1 Tax=Adlercreutzia sp. ZJ138 TaxID=2709405 RepID=UPI0013EB021E|nr:ATP-binding protein [Adlercreutzia sp. ZJ138]